VDTQTKDHGEFANTKFVDQLENTA